MRVILRHFLFRSDLRGWVAGNEGRAPPAGTGREETRVRHGSGRPRLDIRNCETCRKRIPPATNQWQQEEPAVGQSLVIPRFIARLPLDLWWLYPTRGRCAGRWQNGEGAAVRPRRPGLAGARFQRSPAGESECVLFLTHVAREPRSRTGRPGCDSRIQPWFLREAHDSPCRAGEPRALGPAPPGVIARRQAAPRSYWHPACGGLRQVNRFILQAKICWHCMILTI